MTGTASFVTFWTGIVSDKSLPLQLWRFALVVVLSCPLRVKQSVPLVY